MIQPNKIVCEAGVPKKVTLLSATPLPSGLQFSSSEQSLIGTANEKVIQAPYEFYLENDAGYTRIRLMITIQ